MHFLGVLNTSVVIFQRLVFLSNVNGKLLKLKLKLKLDDYTRNQRTFCFDFYVFSRFTLTFYMFYLIINLLSSFLLQRKFLKSDLNIMFIFKKYPQILDNVVFHENSISTMCNKHSDNI